MTWHVADYTVAIGTTANTDVPALSDDVLSIQNSHFILRSPMKLLWAHALSATLARVRFDSPTMRYYGNPFIRPINVAALPGNNPNIGMYSDHAIVLPAGEEIAIQGTSAIAMGTERLHVTLGLEDHFEPPPAGNRYTVRFTGTATATANAWTTVAYSLDQALPAGKFVMVDSELVSTTIVAHRWIFDEQISRPGFLGTAALGNRMPYEFYREMFGRMGAFWNTALPRLQVLCTAADTAQEGYCTLVKAA